MEQSSTSILGITLAVLLAGGCGSSKECMPGTKRCNSENNAELCAANQKS